MAKHSTGRGDAQSIDHQSARKTAPRRLTRCRSWAMPSFSPFSRIAPQGHSLTPLWPLACFDQRPLSISAYPKLPLDQRVKGRGSRECQAIGVQRIEMNSKARLGVVKRITCRYVSSDPASDNILSIVLLAPPLPYKL